MSLDTGLTRTHKDHLTRKGPGCAEGGVGEHELAASTAASLGPLQTPRFAQDFFLWVIPRDKMGRTCTARRDFRFFTLMRLISKSASSLTNFCLLLPELESFWEATQQSDITRKQDVAVGDQRAFLLWLPHGCIYYSLNQHLQGPFKASSPTLSVGKVMVSQLDLSSPTFFNVIEVGAGTWAVSPRSINTYIVTDALKAGI